MGKRVFKRFDIAVAAADSKVSQTFDLDADIVAIHGVTVNSNRDEQVYYRGSVKLEINRDEIFPEDFQAKLLMSGMAVSPNDRFYRFTKEDLGDHRIKVEYRDSAGLVPFQAYTFSIYFDCEIND